MVTSRPDRDATREVAAKGSASERSFGGDNGSAGVSDIESEELSRHCDGSCKAAARSAPRPRPATTPQHFAVGSERFIQSAPVKPTANCNDAPREGLKLASRAGKAGC
eukprot:7662873-Alexandrium_andersonii.AAC.1